MSDERLRAEIIRQTQLEPKRCPRCVVLDSKQEGEWLKCRVHAGCVDCNWSGIQQRGGISTPCYCFEGIR